MPAAGTENDAFTLLFASNDMPGMLYSQPNGSQTYRNGEDAAVADGYFIDMMDYLELAPNYVSWLNDMEDFSRGATNEEFFMVAAPQPMRTGDKAVTPSWRDYSVGSDHMDGQCMLFSADSKYIEEAIRWNDGFYAEDVYWNANYGLEEREGVVWYAAEDGHRIGNYDFRYSNPDGLSSAAVVAQYWAKNPPVRVEAAQIEQMSDDKKVAYDIWSVYEPSSFIPTRVNMTSEERTAYASKYVDIEAYVQEANVAFIMGQRPLDEYDAYRETLKTMGVEECQALYQAAYDRYLAH